MDLLVVAFILSMVAVILFVVQAFKENWQNLASIGFALFAGSLAALIAHWKGW